MYTYIYTYTCTCMHIMMMTMNMCVCVCVCVCDDGGGGGDDDGVDLRCFVQHVNDSFVVPWMKTNLLDTKEHVMMTDGAPQHYKHSSNGGWISHHYNKHGIRLRWLVGAPGHRKDVMDGESGNELERMIK